MSLSISVVIPCHNAEAFLAEAVESVQRQLRQPHEVIVVDDGSSDASVELARSLGGVTVLRMPARSGPSAARNAGARAASGGVIAWLDADDRWEPNHLARIEALFLRHPAAAVAFTRARQFGTRSGEWPALIAEDTLTNPFWTALRRCLLLPSTGAVRRQPLLDAGGFDESLRLAEDFELWVRLADRGAPFVCTHEITCAWRQHSANSGADLGRYQEAEYRVRRRFWAAANTPGNETAAARLRAALTEIWEWHLRDAWHSRSADYMRFHLSMRKHVPGSSVRAVAWRVRLLLVGLVARLDQVRAATRPALGAR